eukprot:PhM_4_TR12221/c0_g1_i1/m.44126
MELLKVKFEKVKTTTAKYLPSCCGILQGIIPSAGGYRRPGLSTGDGDTVILDPFADVHNEPAGTSSSTTTSQQQPTSFGRAHERLTASAFNARVGSLYNTTLTGDDHNELTICKLRGECDEAVDAIVSAVAEDLDPSISSRLTHLVLKDCDLSHPGNTLLEDLLSHVPTLTAVHFMRCELPILVCVTLEAGVKITRCRLREVHLNALTRWVDGGGCCQSLVISGEKGLASLLAPLQRLQEACELNNVKLQIVD